MYQILLVEDDVQIRELIEDYFSSKENSPTVTSACDGARGLEYIKSREFDLIMLDIMMPHIDGFTLCREVRKCSDVPVLFITARTLEEDILYGFELGCDDYVIKPFSLATLYAKTKALLNRANKTVLNQNVQCGAIVINRHTMEVFVNGSPVELPPKEYALLNYLIAHKDWVISRETLIANIWIDNDIVDRVVDNHIKKLRKALGCAGSQIKTVISKGYKITD